MAWQANFGTLLRSDSLLRLWRYIAYLLTWRLCF